MPEIGLELALVLVLILGAEFVNGWTDAPNAIATVVGTRSLSPFQAISMASLFNLLGVLSGTAVAKTIGTGIVEADAVDLVTIGGAMVAIIVWSTIAARWGLPTSESHALVASLTGAGFATAGTDALLWDGWEKVLLGLVFSTVLGLAGGVLLMAAIYRLFRNAVPGRITRSFRWLQVGSAAFMAFAHGSNDGQKFMGAFALALVLGGRLAEFAVPTWVIVLCAAVMALGTSIGGWRIIRTMGMRVTRLRAHQGFAAEIASASTIELATRLGIPLSTTHTIANAIVGVGAAQGTRAVRWGVTLRIVAAWILTFPACAAISYSLVALARLL